jgi:hypothetical protein
MPCAPIGVVTETGIFRVRGQAGNLRIEADIAQLKATWQHPLQW